MTINKFVKESFNKYVDIFFPFKEKFNGCVCGCGSEYDCGNEYDNNRYGTSFLFILLQLLFILTMVFAIYLAWKCNGNKFDFIHMFVAFLYSPIYIIYQFIVNGFCGIF
jgi:hypothetical protein